MTETKLDKTYKNKREDTNKSRITDGEHRGVCLETLVFVLLSNSATSEMWKMRSFFLSKLRNKRRARTCSVEDLKSPVPSSEPDESDVVARRFVTSQSHVVRVLQADQQSAIALKFPAKNSRAKIDTRLKTIQDRCRMWSNPALKGVGGHHI